MKSSIFACLALAASSVSGHTYERLDKTKAALLIVDQQVGLAQMVRDYSPNEYRVNMLAHAAMGNVFSLPTVMTTSAETGPNGPLPKEIIEMHPNAPLIKRPGEVNAWDNADFRAAVNATGRTQLIVAGITTDVCTAHLALSLREAGYSVWANIDASGAMDEKAAAIANSRMEIAGVTVTTAFSIYAELLKDWRNTPGTKETVPHFATYIASFSNLARTYGYAVQNGSIIPGLAQLL